MNIFTYHGNEGECHRQFGHWLYQDVKLPVFTHVQKSPHNLEKWAGATPFNDLGFVRKLTSWVSYR